MNHRSNLQSKPRLEGTSDKETYLSDWQVADSIGTAVVLSVAASTDRQPTELPELSRAVDPDALEHLLDGFRESVEISFEYAGCEVSLKGDGELVIQ